MNPARTTVQAKAELLVIPAVLRSLRTDARFCFFVYVYSKITATQALGNVRPTIEPEPPTTMSYLLKLIRQSQSRMINRSSLLAGNKIYESSQTARPLYQKTKSPFSTSAPILAPSSSSSSPPSDQNEKTSSDDNKYVIKLKKELTYGELFKDTYKIYGPIFIGTHISISLLSLGFWYTLVWLTVDPTQYLSQHMLNVLSDNVLSVTGEGSKFVIAYAVHKLTLPLRLAGSIWLTKILSKIVKSKRKDIDTS